MSNMTPAIDFIAEAKALAHQLEQQSPTPWLQDFRAAQLKQFAGAQWPSRKTEKFKYNNLNSLVRESFATQPNEVSTSLEKCGAIIDGINAEQAVFVDGFFNASLSTIQQHQVTLFSDANESQQELILNHLAPTDSKNNLFTTLNDSLAQQGLLIEFNQHSPNVPLHVLHLSTTDNTHKLANARHLVLLEKHCTATLIEHFATENLEHTAALNQRSEFIISDNAQLNHYRLHTENENLIHLGSQDFKLYRDAKLNSFQLGLGSKIKRNDIDVHHLESGSHADLNGIYLAKHTQQVDFHTNIEHTKPHCTTSEVFRGIVDDKAKAVFNGRIHIHPDAQKTLAELSNKNLLLSNRAEINTKPELEIYADDVRCAHGATISRLEDNALFYLQSRGIPKAQAELMLSFGFINELVDNLENDAVAQYLRPIIAAMFTHDA